MKIKAFTLIEIIIAMLISSIVISIMVSLYLNFSMTSVQQTREQELENDISTLYSSLSSDMYKAEDISLSDNKILKIQRDEGMVKYMFREDELIRIFAGNRDTLRVSTGEIEINKEGASRELIINIKEKKGYKLKFTSRKLDGRY